MRTRARAADPTAVDVPYLATTFDVAEDELQTLLDAPTAELVKSFLASLTGKAQEFDELKAEKLKVDVELENTVRTSETKVKAQKATVTRHAKEIEELRTKLNEAEGARESLATELDQLKNSSNTSGAETQALRTRIETLEASNRDALALVESKSSEKDRVANELSQQHSKLLELRRDVNQLEERNQSLENAASSQKFKEQSLQQEIDLLKRNNEWNNNELQTRGQEHAKFRKERNARIASLERELEDSNANVDTLKRTETTLRQRLDDLQAKAEEGFAKVASLQDDFAKKEQDFRAQLDSTKRLADLQAQNASTHKARLHDVQGQVDQIKEDAAEEIGRLQAEIDTERTDKQRAEQRIAELELQVEQLEQQPRASAPGTPLRNGGLDPTTPLRFGSPAVPNSAQKIARNLSHTQLYSQFVEAKEALLAEERRSSKLQTALDELIQEFEHRAPEIQEMRGEQARLENEVLGFSRMLDESNENRDAAVKESQRCKGEADAAAREAVILRQQLRDLSTQIKMLLVEMQSRDQGLAEMSAQERFELERAARGELEDGSLDAAYSTGRFISERLVIFRDVSELQARNADLLKITRDLGEQMEGAEAQEKARQSASDAAEVEELREQVGRYKDELQATATQIDTYMKERDMFRRMLQHRGTLQPDADMQAMFGQSIMPATPQRNGSTMEPPTPRSKDVEDLNKLLKEQQTFFDQYRNESATDRRMLKDQVDSLARDKSSLQAEVARAQSQYALSNERLEMFQANMAALRNENSELQKRNQSMSENAAKQDLRTQQVAEDLVDARAMADSLRTENANAKAEKELWKRIESRLTEDNKSLMDDRSRLNKLVADMQNMQNERELADSETRRRTQARIEGLEAELTDTKRKLETEVEDSRKASQRREYEENQSRTRIDDLVKSLGNVREELVAAKTTRDQLQSRVDEMKIELRAAEEKVTALQPRPTPRAETNGDQQPNGDEELSVEQRLGVEVSELKRDLELARSELESAREQVEQYKSIAQSTEEELASFTETSDQYKEENDRLIAEKETRITQLEQRIEDLSSELTTSNNELSELRTKHDDSSRVLNEQKASYESELLRLRDDADRYSEEKKLYQEDLKAQAEIAQQAQQSYENELVKHADAARSLQTARKEYNDLRTEVAGIRAEAEAAKVSLERGEESWSEQKDRFEREIEDMRNRRADVDAQNKLLHQQMESFSTELQTLRSGRAVQTGEGEERAGSPAAGGESGSLQEVIKYLRREKEIVEVQYELSIQDTKRLQQQLEYANTQLDDVRQKLAEERRQSSDRMASEGSTNKLMQTINELNLYRESATTLRNEARQARERLDEKAREVERLLSEMEPLKGRVGELEGDLENKEGEMKLLQQDRDHWRERTQNIISKYDRVDPAELEELKKQLEELKTEKERLEAEQAPLQEQIDGFDARIATEREDASRNLTERLEKFKEQAKEQNRKQNSRLVESKAATESAQAEQTRLAGELETVRAELEQTKTARDEAITRAESAAAAKEEGQVNDATPGGEEHATLHARIAEAESQASEHASRADELGNQVQTLQARVEELESQVSSLQGELETAKVAQPDNGEDEGEINESGVDTEVLDKLRQDLATAQQEVETLRANAASAPSQPDDNITNAEPAAGEKSVADQVAEQVQQLRSEMEAQHQTVLQQTEEASEKKLASMKANLTRQLKDEREKMRIELTAETRQQIVAEHEVEIQKLKDEHAATIQTLKTEHQAEIERLTKEGAAAVQQAKDAEEATKAEGMSPSGAGATATQEPVTAATFDFNHLSDDQAMDLLKNNSRVKQIFLNNVKKTSAKENEQLSTKIAEKDAEIARLTTELETAQKAQPAGEGAPANTAEIEELKAKLESAQAEKEAAVKQAVESAEKKAKVQISQRDIAMAKIGVITKAANETPEKPISEVWEVAKTAKPAPKPAPGPAKPAGAASPAQPAPASPAVASPIAGPSSALGNDQAKLQARQERFGAVTGATPATFGQPSAPSTFGQPSQPSFGQPSAPALQQPARRPSGQAGTPPNPQATAFTPGAGVAANDAKPAVGTGPAALRGLSGTGIPAPGGSRLPRGGATTGIGRGGPQGLNIQGAARGGIQQSGLPRGGGGQQQGGRGGRGGRGGGQGQNQGVKRTFDGAGGGGDEKRQRGGGGGGS